MNATSISAPSSSDALDHAATAIAAPREEPGDSFVLHAPLETLARIGLLDHAADDDRSRILDRIGSIADLYASYDAWDAPGGIAAFAGVEDARSALVGSLAASDFDGVDAAVGWLTTHLDAGELIRAVVDPILPSLAAAAHGSIFLYLLPRVAARNLPAATMLRTTAHELARRPELRLTFVDDLPAVSAMSSADAGAELERRLVRPASVSPGSNFIFPVMDAVERNGLAADVTADLAGSLSVRDARHALLRTAARSMLQDDRNHAPYGWSHCLTMPQATLGVADAAERPEAAIAIAATYVLGFRSALGSTTIDPAWMPEPPTSGSSSSLDLDTDLDHAVAQAWHAAVADRPAIWRQLAGHAGAHEDAHLAKYTLACLDATRGDPSHEHLYLAAAAHLNAWWATQS